MVEKEPTKKELTHPEKHKAPEAVVKNEGSSIEQVVREDKPEKFTEKQIQDIKERIEFNRTADKKDQKEVSLEEEQAAYPKDVKPL